MERNSENPNNHKDEIDNDYCTRCTQHSRREIQQDGHAVGCRTNVEYATNNWNQLEKTQVIYRFSGFKLYPVYTVWEWIAFKSICLVRSHP